MSLQTWKDVDLCNDCIYFVTYGTVGDASAGEPSDSQKRTDLDHAALMFNTLGLTPVMFDSSDDIDGSFSHSGCEGCGKQDCHVFTGTLAYEESAEQ